MSERGDHNAPTVQPVPFWGPDRYSLRTALKALMRSSSVIAATTGVGVRPAPIGSSQTEGVKTDAWFPFGQQVRGINRAIANPANMYTSPVAQLPSSKAQINPVLADFGRTYTLGRWDGT